MDTETILKIIAAATVLLTAVAAVLKALQRNLTEEERIRILAEALAVVKGVDDEVARRIRHRIEQLNSQEPSPSFRFRLPVIAGLLGSCVMWWLAFVVFSKGSFLWGFLIAFYGIAPLLAALHRFPFRDRLPNRLAGG